MARRPPVNFLARAFESLFKGQQLQLHLYHAPNSLLRTSASPSPVRNGKCHAKQLRQVSFHTGLLLQEQGVTAGDSIKLKHAGDEGALAAALETSYTVVERLPSPTGNAIRSTSRLKDISRVLEPSAVPGRRIGEGTSTSAEEEHGNEGDGAAINHLVWASRKVPASGRPLQGHLVKDASVVVPSQTSLTDARESDAPGWLGPTEEGLSDKINLSPGSSDGRPHKGRCRRQGPCQHKGCKVRRGNYGFPDEDGTMCRRHKQPGMTILFLGCEEPGCNTQATFNYPDRRGVARCKAHKAPGMVKKNVPVCCSTGCTQTALYGREGETSPSFCPDHKSQDMIYIHPYPAGRCHSPGCMEQGTYAHSRNKRQRLCAKHKGEGMMSVTGAVCEEEGCSKKARYGWPGRGVWLVCGKHKKEGMVPSWCCMVEGCSKIGYYKLGGDETQRRCAKHRGEGVAPRRRVCSFEGCSTTATFRFPQDKSTLVCKAHKEEGMVNTNYKTCDMQGCEEKAYYALPGERAARCPEHRNTEMVNVKNRVCKVGGCKRPARFGLLGDLRTHCDRHKDDNMSGPKPRSKQKEALDST